ncbi:MAG TPA: ribose-phosphate diphosphokinase, partial [Phycisphaerae bacterium]
MNDRPILVFATESYAYLQRAICAAGGFACGSIQGETFPDGERYHRIESDIAGLNVALVGGTINDADTLDIFDLACGLVSYGAHSLTLMIPYFGYSTMERAVLPGEIVTAKNRARLFSGIPPAPAGNRVILLDLHSEGIAHYFENGVATEHVYAKPVIVRAARRLGGEDFVLACTDAGRAKWVESLANDLGVDASFVFKRRLDAEHTEVAGISADVRGRSVVIYDDMIRTGSSLESAARAYLAAGATRVAAIATHGLFPDGALEHLKQSGLFTQIICTDSHPRA